jgi:hypothetical protein
MGNSSSVQLPDSTLPGTSSSTPAAAAATQGISGAQSCPVPEQYRSQPIYNVYGQQIDVGSTASPLDFLRQGQQLDPSNQMPAEPNQLPFPGQHKLLSTSRQQSNIPKGGTDSTWLYPSPQMFYNGEHACFKSSSHNLSTGQLQRYHIASSLVLMPGWMTCSACSEGSTVIHLSLPSPSLLLSIQVNN